MVYYVVLRGGVEKLGVYPKDLNITIEASSLITKKDGGTVAVNKFLNPVNKAKIEIPADPSPEYPDNFTPPEQGLATAAVAFSDPDKPYDCMWEDTEIRIGRQENVPEMKTARQAGPAVYIGPYRTIFNKDVTITIPYRRLLASPPRCSPLSITSSPKTGMLLTAARLISCAARSPLRPRCWVCSRLAWQNKIKKRAQKIKPADPSAGLIF